MSESAPAPEAKPKTTEAKPAPTPVIDDKRFVEILHGMLGKVVLFVNAESFEEGGLGYTLEAGWYRGKLSAIGRDYLTIVSEFKHGVGKNATKEPIRQFVPMDKVKRVTLMKTQILIHI